MTAFVTLLGVGLNAVVPEEAFEIVLNVACLGILGSWATIVLCQLKLLSWAKKGLLQRPSFRMFGAPYSGYLVLVFLAGVLVLVGLDYPVGTWTVGSIAVIVPLLILGWFLCRARITAIAEERSGFTGKFPVIANRPLAERNRSRADDRDEDPVH